MMDSKVLVEVLVPASGEKYDVFIPLTVRMGEVAQMVSSVINDLSAGRFRATEQTMLFNADTGVAYNVNTVVAELNIQNGTRLMLI
jgi:hypothetical protein